MSATVLQLSGSCIHIYAGTIDFSTNDYMSKDKMLQDKAISRVIEVVESSDNNLEFSLMLKYVAIAGLYNVTGTNYQTGLIGRDRTFAKNFLKHSGETSEVALVTAAPATPEHICLVLRDGDIIRKHSDILRLFPDIESMPKINNLKYAIPSYFIDISMSKFKTLTNALKWRYNYNPFMPSVRKYIERLSPDIRYSFTLQESQAICISKDDENNCWYVDDNNGNMYSESHRNYAISNIMFSSSDGISYFALDSTSDHIYDGSIKDLGKKLMDDIKEDVILYSGVIYCIIAKF